MRFNFPDYKRGALLLIVLLIITTSLLSAQGIGWKLIDAKIHGEFPDVPRLTTADLAALLEKDGAAKPVLLDVRTKAEFDVSHLSGAIRVEPTSDSHKLSLPKNRPIITYCSVGYRSAAMAKKLRDTGYSNVANLEGSIFRWANEKRLLVHNDGRPTDKVHPYNALWGMLVEPKHRAKNAPPPEPAREGR